MLDCLPHRSRLQMPHQPFGVSHGPADSSTGVLAAMLDVSSAFSCHCLRAKPRLPGHEELHHAETGSLGVEFAELICPGRLDLTPNRRFSCCCKSDKPLVVVQSGAIWSADLGKLSGCTHLGLKAKSIPCPSPLHSRQPVTQGRTRPRESDRDPK